MHFINEFLSSSKKRVDNFWSKQWQQYFSWWYQILLNSARALKKKHPSLDCSKADAEFTECHAEWAILLFETSEDGNCDNFDNFETSEDGNCDNFDNFETLEDGNCDNFEGVEDFPDRVVCRVGRASGLRGEESLQLDHRYLSGCFCCWVGWSCGCGCGCGCGCKWITDTFQVAYVELVVVFPSYHTFQYLFLGLFGCGFDRKLVVL